MRELFVVDGHDVLQDIFKPLKRVYVMLFTDGEE